MRLSGLRAGHSWQVGRRIYFNGDDEDYRGARGIVIEKRGALL